MSLDHKECVCLIYILRVSSNINGLGITYKYNQNKMIHILLTRVVNEDGVYKIGSSNTRIYIKFC